MLFIRNNIIVTIFKIIVAIKKNYGIISCTNILLTFYKFKGDVRMKKFFGVIAATAVAASLALSTTVASADVIWAVPDDPEQWATWFEGSPALSEATEISAESTADGMRVWFPDTATGAFKICSFLMANGAGFTAVEPDDELHVDVTLEGDAGGTDVRWIMQLAFNGAGTGNMSVSKYIAAAANNGQEANQYGQMPQGHYELVIPMGDLIEQFDADNATTNYDKIWNSGANNTKLLTGVILQIATNNPEKNSDKDLGLVIHDISINTAGSVTVDNDNSQATTTPSTSSSAGTTSTGSSASKPAATSSKGQVSTVVATSAVVVTKKRAK